MLPESLRHFVLPCLTLCLSLNVSQAADPSPERPEWKDRQPAAPVPGEEFEVPVRPWKYVVIHHSATIAGSVEAIDAEHRQRLDSQRRPWRGIGYHFVIGNGHGMEDGELAATFRWQDQLDGAHAGTSEFNQWGLGICLIGNFEETPPTPAQLVTLSALLDHLKSELRLTDQQVLRHGDLKATDCPGKLFNITLLNGAQSEIVPVSGDDNTRRFTPVIPANREEIHHVAQVFRFRSRRPPVSVTP